MSDNKSPLRSLNLFTTYSFLFSSTSKPTHQPKGRMQCPFCKGPHSASLCETIKDPKQRSDVVHQERLCFNCLGHHKVSSCNSKHRCHHYRRKHHTSLCTYGQQPPTPTNLQHAATKCHSTNRIWKCKFRTSYLTTCPSTTFHSYNHKSSQH